MERYFHHKRAYTKALHGMLILALSSGLLLGALPGSHPAIAAVQADLVINGSFEEPVAPNAGFYYLPSIPGWSLSQGSFFELQRDVWPAAEGAQVLELDSNGSTSVYQDLPTTPGEGYLLAFAFSARPEQPEAENVFEVRWNGTPLSDPITADGTGLLTTNWTTYSFTVVASASTSRIEFAYMGPPDRYGSLIDNVSLIPLGVIGNDSWTTARALALTPDVPASAGRVLYKPGQSAWYKFSVVPGSRAVVELTGLPANYDLTLYKDIPAAFQALRSTQDLARLGAEFAPDAFSPDAFSPDAFSPDAFSPDAFSPDAFSPDAFSPDAFSPDAFSPDAFSPDAFSPDAFSPDAFSPDAFSPDAFSPDAFSPDAFSSEAYSSAQTRSLIGVSAFDGTASEGIAANTWDNSGDFYVRVRGRNGAFSLAAPFHMQVTLLSGSCGSVSPALPPTSTTPSAGGYKTIVLTDLARMEGTPEEITALQERLASFASRPEVSAVVVNAGADARVAAANVQADANLECPYAKNLVAEAILSIIASYRALNPLEYVVIAGNDDAIPFFRHPDGAMLASEKNYAPPVRDATASQASLKLGYVLSQDRYGAQTEVSLKSGSLPIPDLAVGRLVETPAEVTGLLDVYLNTPGGVSSTPTSALVTGYDFLEDAALAVKAELEAGTGNTADALISPRNLSPQDPAAWTASQLSELLLGRRHDLIFLAGHFSASSALAADYSTRLTAAELASSDADLTNAVVFSAGCHAAYSIVNGHGIPNVTLEPDWTQAFARKGAALIAGTGYQYGDTDFIEYSERLYLEFSRQLRAGSGPVPIGKALVAAKQAYLAGTSQWRGIHEKALLQATLFGLPMLSLDLPQGRGSLPGDTTTVSATTPATSNPGAALSLSYADIDITPSLTEHSLPLTDPADGTTVNAFYLSGANGVLANPAEPVLPLERRNVSVTGQVLRGIGFRSGAYTDLPGILPLTGAATTEVRGVHTPFMTSIFYPARPWNVNYYDALAKDQDGQTRLMVFPAQFQSSSTGEPAGTLRKYSSLGFRLYYSGNTATYPSGNIPALSAPPSIAIVSSTVGSGEVNFDVSVTGDPAAGIQEVWVTFTALSGPLAGAWQSLDLSQNTADSTLWQGLLPLEGTPAQDLRYIVQAVNGVGLVSLSTNLGAYFTPGVDPAAQVGQGQPTELTLLSPPSTGPYGTQVTLSALLTSSGTPLAGERVTFGIGSQRHQSITGSDGIASADLPLLSPPGDDQVQVTFAGDESYASSWTSSTFTTQQQATSLLLTEGQTPARDGTLMATLQDAEGRPLGQKTVFFSVQGNGLSFATSMITDYAGQAFLDEIPLPDGSYSVEAYFTGSIPLPEGTVTLEDERYLPSSASGTLELNNAPVCYTAVPSQAVIWPPDKKFVRIDVSGISHPKGEALVITINSIFQDERVGDDHHSSPDGRGVGDSYAKVRAERDEKGDGRVYHISFTAADAHGRSCSGEVLVQVPHNQNRPAVDGGALYDSTVRDDDD